MDHHHPLVLWISAILFLITGNLSAGSSCINDGASANILHHGYEYSYAFKSEGIAEAVGTTDDRSRITLACTVSIKHSHECYYKLMMRDCFLNAIGGPPYSEASWITNKALSGLTEHPVVFSLVNGAIGNLHTEPDDSTFYVNIKRAAISAFVFDFPSTSKKISKRMRDIHGNCPMHSIPMSGFEGGVKRTKDMMHCAFPSRPDWQFSPWSIFWNMSFIQYQINSTSNCEYKINIEDQTLDKMFCKERHAIGLESTHRTTTAVQTNIYYQMNHIRTTKLTKAITRELPPVETGIEFEYEKTPDPDRRSQPEDFLVQAETMLSEMVEISQEEIRLYLIRKFNDFIALLRTSYDLSPLVESVRNCNFLRNDLNCNKMNKELAMSYFSDALVQCNTVPCFEAIGNLAVKNDLSTAYLNFVLYSWNNMHYTKPRIITSVMNICNNKDSNFCRLVLGTMIKKFYSSEPSTLENESELKKVAEELHETVINTCNPNNDIRGLSFDDEVFYLKAIGNAGNAYLKYVPKAAKDILKCVKKSNLPTHLRLVSMEILRKMNLCADTDFCRNEFQTFYNMMEASSLDKALKISAYHQLMLTPEEQNFEVKLIQFLHDEKDSDLKSYVASDLKNHIEDVEFNKDHPVFISRLKNELESNEVFLEELSHQSSENEKSHAYAFGRFVKLVFLPEEMQGFGAKIEESTIAPIAEAVSHFCRKNVNVKLFDKAINLFEAGYFTDGLKSFGLLYNKLSASLNSETQNLDHEAITQAFQAFANVREELLKDVKFDDNLLNNIKKIVGFYRKYHSEVNPYLSVYLDMFGSNLITLLPGDVNLINNFITEFLAFFESLKNGIEFRTTRVVRVIEAYHQVPTMMGLPLNWMTNATLAISVGGGLKHEYSTKNSIKMFTNGFLHPSMALTFTNQMVLEFPTVTQIGVQSNSTAYTSTQFKASIEDSEQQKRSVLKIDLPEKSQKVLELFRTNQLIKHNSYEDIPDWDIQRTTASWCSKHETNAIVGMKICHERTYPNDTHLIKPWALMAGSCKWRLTLEPLDNIPKSYDFEIIKPTNKLPNMEMEMILSLPGDHNVLADLHLNMASGDFNSSLKMPNISPFELSVFMKKMLDDSRPDSLVLHRNLKMHLPSKEVYELMYEVVQKEARKDETPNKSPSSENTVPSVEETLLALRTPDDLYKMTISKDTKRDSKSVTTKTEYEFKYLNYNSQPNRLVKSLPSSFWESELEANAKLHSLFKYSAIPARKESSVHWLCLLETPHDSTEMLLDRTSTKKSQKFILNFNKHDESSKLLSFANVTYDEWMLSDDQADKFVRNLNLTIPQRSFGFTQENALTTSGMTADVSHVIAKMLPKDERDSNYVGWWSDELSDQFDLSISEYKLKVNVIQEHVETPEVIRRFPNINEKDIQFTKKHGIFNAKLVYQFPGNDEQDYVEFNGLFVVSYEPINYRFQKDFTLFSTVLDTELSSHSVYRADEINTQIGLNSFMTHKGSRTKAYYNMEYSDIINEHGCMEKMFNHNISSHVLDFASNVSYKCRSGNIQLHTLKLNLDSSSNYWDMLNLKIRQIVEDLTPQFSQESTHINHPLMAIDVVAQWKDGEHTKIATFNKMPKNEECYRLKINRKSLLDYEVILDVAANGVTKPIKATFRQKISNDEKTLRANLLFSSGEKEHKVVELRGVIFNPSERLYTLEIYPESDYITDIMENDWKMIKEGTIAIAKNQNHPLNKILKPALKMTLFEYLSRRKIIIEQESALSRKEWWDAYKRLTPIFEPITITLTNTVNAAAVKAIEIYSIAEKKSIAIWAIKYFKLPQLFHEGLQHFSQGIWMLSDIVSPPDEIQRYTFTMNHNMFKRASFKELPQFPSYPDLHAAATKLFQDTTCGNTEAIDRHHVPYEGSKVAMIFGPRYVYTFDGLLYEFPEYPAEDCSYLLAHDVIRNYFTAVTTAKDLILIFPEMVVRINSNYEVFIDESQEAVSLPVQSENEKVGIVMDGRVIKVWSPSIVVLCNGDNEICVFELNKWNVGGTIGLLGNADGETHNDFTLPDGSITSDVTDFAKSFEVSGKGQCKNLKNVPKQTFDPSSRKICSFEMGRVCDSYDYQTQNFLEPCMMDKQNGTGYSKIALAALCYNKNELMYNHCEGMWDRNEVKYSLDIDIVLIVDEQARMNKTGNIQKGIEAVINAVHNKFHAEHYSPIRFGLIGYSGKGVRYQPSVHTVGRDIFVPQKTAVTKLLKTLEFEGETKMNPVKAFKFAIENFDDKPRNQVFILFTDKASQDLHGLKKGITKYRCDAENQYNLFTVADYPSINKGKKVFGVRADGLIFPSPKGQESYMEYPKGELAKLTSASRGSIFLKKFVNANGPSSYFTELANEIYAKKENEYKTDQFCGCYRSGFWYDYFKCSTI